MHGSEAVLAMYNRYMTIKMFWQLDGLGELHLKGAGRPSGALTRVNDDVADGEAFVFHLPIPRFVLSETDKQTVNRKYVNSQLCRL